MDANLSTKQLWNGHPMALVCREVKYEFVFEIKIYCVFPCDIRADHVGEVNFTQTIVLASSPLSAVARVCGFGSPKTVSSH